MQRQEATLDKVPDLVALRVCNGALKGEKLPSEIKIFNWGDNPSTKGVFKAGQKTGQLLELNQRALGFERVAIDYNHCSVPGSPEYVQGKPPAIFGYGTVKVRPGQGIFLEDVEWTPLGLSEARNFEDLSPALHPDTPGEEVDFVHSVALTTNGSLYDVTFFSAALPGHVSEPEPKIMSNNNAPVGVIMLATMAAALGLSAEANEAAVIDKIKKLSALEPLDGLLKDGKIVVLDSLSNLDSRVQKIEEAGTKQIATLSAIGSAGKVVTLSAQDLVGLSERLSTLEGLINLNANAATDRERGELVSLFSAQGKVPKNTDGAAYTADDLKKLDLPTLKLLHANTPSTVPLHARGKNPQEGRSTEGLKGLKRTAAAFAEQMSGVGA